VFIRPSDNSVEMNKKSFHKTKNAVAFVAMLLANSTSFCSTDINSTHLLDDSHARFGGPLANGVFQDTASRLPSFLAHNMRAGHSFANLLNDAIALRTDIAGRSGTENPEAFQTKSKIDKDYETDLAICCEAFNAACNFDGYIQEKYIKIMDFTYLFAKTKLYTRGTTAVAEWFSRGLCLYKGIEDPKLNVKMLAQEGVTKEMFFNEAKSRFPLIDIDIVPSKNTKPELAKYGGTTGNTLFQSVSADMKNNILPKLIKSGSPFEDIVEQAKEARFKIACESRTEFYNAYGMYRKDVKRLLVEQPELFNIHESLKGMEEIGGLVDRCVAYPLMLQRIQEGLARTELTSTWHSLNDELEYRFRIEPIIYWLDSNNQNDINVEFIQIITYLMQRYPGELCLSDKGIPDSEFAARINYAYQQAVRQIEDANIKIGYFESRIKNDSTFNRGYLFLLNEASLPDFNNVPMLLLSPYFSTANAHWLVVKEAFDCARKSCGSESDIRKAIAKFHYKWGSAMPVRAGSSAIGEWLAGALYATHNLGVPKASPHVHAHFDQLIQSSFTVEEFLKEYQELFYVPVSFERIMTLGDCCTTKEHVRIYFKRKYGDQDLTYTGGNYLFDWMVPGNLSLLSDALSGRLEDVCGADMKVIEKDPFGKGVLFDEKYDMIFNHIFDRHETITHQVVEGKLTLTQELFNEHFDQAKSKIDHLKKKTLSALQKGDELKTALYVIFGVSFSKVEHFTKQNIIKLRDTILSMRQDKNFALLFILQQDYGFDDFENIMFRKVSFSETPYIVTTKAINEWWKIFDEFRFT
jgi:hypothetical protein